LPNFAKLAKLLPMSTMNISLPDELKQFVDQRIQSEGYGTSSEYMRELIRRDRDRAQFRQYVLDGMQSPLLGRVDESYFESLSQRVQKHRAKKK
jgi:antitoxin ParD1/3/4